MSDSGPSADKISGMSAAEKENDLKDGGRQAFKESEAVEIDDEEEDVIDDEQLEEYQEMVDQLGGFPVGVYFRLIRC